MTSDFGNYTASNYSSDKSTFTFEGHQDNTPTVYYGEHVGRSQSTFNMGINTQLHFNKPAHSHHVKNIVRNV